MTPVPEHNQIAVVLLRERNNLLRRMAASQICLDDDTLRSADRAQLRF